jgi:hypothetical protein
MRARSWFVVFALLVAFAAPGRAQEKEDQDPGSYWSSIFSDFFMGPERKDEFRWHGRIAPGATLEIKGVSGRVVAEPATGREVELVATKRGRRNDPKEVEIAFAEHAGGLTVCALYKPASDAQPNECKPGKGGRMSVRNNDVAVDFVVRVPEGVSFVARTVNGNVRVARLSANVEAYTVNGSVRLEASGHAQAETVNGSIRATLGKTDWKDAVSFRTVNGSVVVALPAAASASVRVETVNGSISNDFTLTGPTKTTRRQLQGTIGGGGRELQVKTVNGSVTLRRAS